ncbi:MAG: thiamine diphosphokinase [Spirochaetaceae bacterium]|jgi:thiamine pyrophosphokinase|nr:thiamine diphosphokinase [Spirochaetaceae bacterium]
MRGIAFIGGEGPSPEISGKLAGEADLCAAADSGLMAAEEAGLHPDWITGDMDSLDDMSRLEKYPADRVIRYSHDKDYTDTELVLELLWSRGCDEVWLIGGGGGRLDHLLAIRSLFEREKAPDRWITAGEDSFCLDSAKTDAREFTQARSGVSVFPLGNGPWKISSGGLKWPLDTVAWNRGFAGVSNEAPEGRFSVSVSAGRFLVILEAGTRRGVLQNI